MEWNIGVTIGARPHLALNPHMAKLLTHFYLQTISITILKYSSWLPVWRLVHSSRVKLRSSHSPRCRGGCLERRVNHSASSSRRFQGRRRIEDRRKSFHRLASRPECLSRLQTLLKIRPGQFRLGNSPTGYSWQALERTSLSCRYRLRRNLSSLKKCS